MRSLTRSGVQSERKGGGEGVAGREKCECAQRQKGKGEERVAEIGTRHTLAVTRNGQRGNGQTDTLAAHGTQGKEGSRQKGRPARVERVFGNLLHQALRKQRLPYIAYPSAPARVRVTTMHNLANLQGTRADTVARARVLKMNARARAHTHTHIRT
jgi:hypothetical protein